MFKRFVESGEPGIDQRPLLRETRGQLCGAIGKTAAGVQLEMPVDGDDIGQEPVKPVRVVDQARIEMARVPLKPAVAASEDDENNRRQGPERAFAMACLTTTVSLV